MSTPNAKYDPDIFQHFNIDVVDKETENKANFIIETGFNLYFLFQIFSEFKESDNSIRVKKEEDEDDKLEKMLRNSIFG